MILQDKQEQIKIYLKELRSIIPKTIDSYDLKTKAACERYIEKIVEASVDYGRLLLKEHGINLPDEDYSVFSLLAEKKIISSDLADTLKRAKGMRNRLAHQYGDIDDEIIFDALQYIGEDIAKFIDERTPKIKKP